VRQLLNYLKGDRVIWIITLLFLSLSLVSVYSFVPILVKTEGGTPFKYLFKHLIYIIIGLLAMYWVHRQDPKYVAKLSKFAFYLAIFLLVFTFFFGVRVNDAARWIRVPIVGLTFQTSDLAKLALVIYLSKLMVNKEPFYDSWRQGFWPIVVPVVVICALIAKDNFSTAAIVFMIGLVMMFIGRVPFIKMMAFIGGGIGAAGLVVLTHLALPAMNLLPRFDTWMARFFKAYGDQVDSISNAQAINAELAIHSGGYFGVGVGSGKLKQYLPEAYADFYFSSFVEEFGMLVAVLLIFLYLVLFYRIVRIGLNAERLFETYMCIGIGLLIMSQAVVNMLVCTGLMPVTGQNMPFLAMGGSAMVMSCVSLGLVLSVANKSQPDNELKPVKSEADD
jgi:cell division protein FtsW